MNKTLRKRLAIGLVSISLSSVIVPSILSVNVFASNNVEYIKNVNTNFNIKKEISDYVDSFEYAYISRVSLDKQEKYKNALKIQLSTYSSINEITFEKTIYLFEKYVANENNFLFIEPRFMGWKGFTIEEFGNAINAALIAAGVATFGAVAGAVVAVKSIIVKTVVSIIGASAGAFVTSLINSLVSSVNIGYSIAKAWDQRDAYPNNGHINF